MAETSINLSEGSGKRTHGWDHSISATTVQDQFVVTGLYPYASYTIATAAINVTTVDSHLLQVMAGASLHVYCTYLAFYQRASATTAGQYEAGVYRLTTAGTGGTSITPQKLDPADSAAGATGMSLPTSKGTEGALLWYGALPLVSTGANPTTPLVIWDYRDTVITKAPRIASGTSNGIALKLTTAATSSTGVVVATIVEVNYT